MRELYFPYCRGSIEIQGVSTLSFTNRKKETAVEKRINIMLQLFWNRARFHLRKARRMRFRSKSLGRKELIPSNEDCATKVRSHCVPIPATTCSYVTRSIFTSKFANVSSFPFFFSLTFGVSDIYIRIKHTCTTWRLDYTWYKCSCFSRPVNSGRTCNSGEHTSRDVPLQAATRRSS